jgi:hypothetical protein
MLTILLRSHIAALLGVSPKTISDYLEDSKPGQKYADDPVPQPEGYVSADAPEGWVPPDQRGPGMRPFWNPDSRKDWLAWRERHPSRMRKAS